MISANIMIANIFCLCSVLFISIPIDNLCTAVDLNRVFILLNKNREKKASKFTLHIFAQGVRR
jgi:hypothetical protein